MTAEKIAEILTAIEEKSPKSYLINDILTPSSRAKTGHIATE